MLSNTIDLGARPESLAISEKPICTYCDINERIEKPRVRGSNFQPGAEIGLRPSLALFQASVDQKLQNVVSSESFEFVEPSRCLIEPRRNSSAFNCLPERRLPYDIRRRRIGQAHPIE